MTGNKISTWTRTEKIADVTLDTANKTYFLRSPDFPTDRWMSGLRFTVEGRATNPHTGGPTGVLADSIFGFIDQVQMKGFYVPSNREEIRNRIRMAALAQLNKQWHNASVVTPASLSVTADATNDFSFSVDLPAFPVYGNGGNGRLREKLDYLWDMPFFRQMELSFQVTDMASVFSGQTTAPALTAFGSTTGSPKLVVEGIFALGGASQFAGVRPASCWRQQQDLNDSSALTTSGLQKKLFELPRGFDLRSLFLMTGSPATGLHAMSTLSDTILSNIQIRLGLNRILRHFDSFRTLRQAVAASHGNQPALGTALIDFCAGGTRLEALQTAGFVVGPTAEVDLALWADVVGASGQSGQLITEELRGTAIWPARK